MQVFELLSILLHFTFTEALLHLGDFIERVLQKGHDIGVLKPGDDTFLDAYLLQVKDLEEVCEPQDVLDIRDFIITDRNLGHRVVKRRVHIIHQYFESTSCCPQWKQNSDLRVALLLL
jgi:hypothetical protein